MISNVTFKVSKVTTASLVQSTFITLILCFLIPTTNGSDSPSDSLSSPSSYSSSSLSSSSPPSPPSSSIQRQSRSNSSPFWSRFGSNAVINQRPTAEMLEQGPVFLGGSFDFDLNELAHLIQPMVNILKNSEIIKVEHRDKHDESGNKVSSGGSPDRSDNGNKNNNKNDYSQGFTFQAPTINAGNTQIKPLITFAVPEVEFLGNHPNQNSMGNHQMAPGHHGHSQRPMRPTQHLHHHPHHYSRPDPYMTAASDSGLANHPQTLSTTTNRKKKKRRKPQSNKPRPLIQIVDDDEEDRDKYSDEEDDSEEDRKDMDETQALDQILELGLPTFLLEEVFGINKGLIKPGKILTQLTFGALARGMIKRFFKSIMLRAVPEPGILRRVAEKSCRSVKGLNLRDSVILPLGVAVTLHPLLLPLMPFMLATLGSLKAIESATCFVSYAFR